jgi:hypothetical protein
MKGVSGVMPARSLHHLGPPRQWPETPAAYPPTIAATRAYLMATLSQLGLHHDDERFETQADRI